MFPALCPCFYMMYKSLAGVGSTNCGNWERDGFRLWSLGRSKDSKGVGVYIEQGSHGHGKSWKKLLSWKVMEKSWNVKISQKVMEKSWNCFFSWLWQLSTLWLSCMLWDTIITISETMWEWDSWKKNKSVMEKSWNPVFRFLWEPW